MSSTTLRNQVSARQPHAGDWDDGHIAVGPGILVCAAMLLGCQETEQAQLVRALALSDDIAFLCRDYDSGQGARLDECPDRVDDGIRHELLALVTQPLTAEVAVLSFSQGEVLAKLDQLTVDFKKRALRVASVLAFVQPVFQFLRTTIFINLNLERGPAGVFLLASVW